MPKHVSSSPFQQGGSCPPDTDTARTLGHNMTVWMSTSVVLAVPFRAYLRREAKCRSMLAHLHFSRGKLPSRH
jgi:hypothetical protein